MILAQKLKDNQLMIATLILISLVSIANNESCIGLPASSITASSPLKLKEEVHNGLPIYRLYFNGIAIEESEYKSEVEHSIKLGELMVQDIPKTMWGLELTGAQDVDGPKIIVSQNRRKIFEARTLNTLLHYLNPDNRNNHLLPNVIWGIDEKALSFDRAFEAGRITKSNRQSQLEEFEAKIARMRKRFDIVNGNIPTSPYPSFLGLTLDGVLVATDSFHRPLFDTQDRLVEEMYNIGFEWQFVKGVKYHTGYADLYYKGHLVGRAYSQGTGDIVDLMRSANQFDKVMEKISESPDNGLYQLRADPSSYESHRFTISFKGQPILETRSLEDAAMKILNHFNSRELERNQQKMNELKKLKTTADQGVLKQIKEITSML